MTAFNYHGSKLVTKFSVNGRAAKALRTTSRRESCFEKLEDRTLFSTFVVNVAGDPTFVPAGDYSLRSAINKANTQGGANLIRFDPTVFSTPQTIDLQTPLTVSNPTAKIAVAGPTAALTLDQNLDMLDSTTLYVDPQATLVVRRLNFTNDNADYGLAVINNAGNLGMLNCTVSGTTNTSGIGGIYNTGLLRMNRVTIANHGDGNSGNAFGAGLANYGTAHLLNVNFISDDAHVAGAIGQSRAGSLTAVNVTVSKCGADTNALGGAIAITGGKATFTDSTIDNAFMLAESTPNGCAGVAMYLKNSSVRLFDDTITNSQLFTLGWGNPGDVPTVGSINIGPKGILTMGNTVASGMDETGGVLLGTGPEIVGDVDSLGHNLIGQTSTLTLGLVPSDLHGTNASPLDPKLNALANNGGYTQTELPKPGSPLINAGRNALIPAGTLTDQRGAARIYGGIVDIGSVEVGKVKFGILPIVFRPLDI